MACEENLISPPPHFGGGPKIILGGGASFVVHRVARAQWTAKVWGGGTLSSTECGTLGDTVWPVCSRSAFPTVGGPRRKVHTVLTAARAGPSALPLRGLSKGVGVRW